MIPPKPRDTIFHILNQTYYPEGANLDWYQMRDNYPIQINKALTTDILSHIVMVMTLPDGDKMTDYYRRTLKSEITNLIWMPWPGGSTAAHVADDIWNALGLNSLYSEQD